MEDETKSNVSLQTDELVQVTFRVKDKVTCEKLVNSWLNNKTDIEYGFELCSLATGSDVLTYEQKKQAIDHIKSAQKLLSNDSGNDLSAMLGMFGGLSMNPSNMLPESVQATTGGDNHEQVD